MFFGEKEKYNCMCITCIQVPKETERSIRSLELELQIAVSCCVGAENPTRLGPSLLEQLVLLAAEPSLQT